MEDIRLGRKTKITYRFVDVGTTWVRIIAANPRRTHVRFNHNSTAVAYWWPDGNQSANTGFVFLRTIPDVEINIQRDGQLACSEIWAISSSGTVRVAIVESVLDDE